MARLGRVEAVKMEGGLPPGQKRVGDLVPAVDLAEFRLRVDGEVKRPLELSWEDFLRLPQVRWWPISIA